MRISFGDIALGTDIRWWWQDGEGSNDVSETSIANAPSFVTLSSS
jgi:hypothetical protein